MLLSNRFSQIDFPNIIYFIFLQNSFIQTALVKCSLANKISQNSQLVKQDFQ